ncbi:MAG: ubiquinone/menaquinone biosynthesis methyltransferase [bacterium]|nr:ubiquinone/menaquinone biosynthesis methyltransferase [bacterium]
MMERSPDKLNWDDEHLASPHEQGDKAARVRHMFDAVAPRYRLVNRLFSAGRDAAWRRRAVQLARISRDDAVLDVACGTGDFLRAFAASTNPPHTLVGCDFAHGMLCEAADGSDRTRWVEADALRLPVASQTFTVASCAFGVRNFQDLDVGLGEMHRALQPGGRIVILEFTRPTHRVIRRLYEFYANRFMPWAATLVSRDRTGAYRYLPRSVVSFIGTSEMRTRLIRAGFGEVTATPMSLGIVSIYVGVR